MTDGIEYEPSYSMEFDKPREACGVYGVFQPGATNLAQQTYIGLLELQHRGQDAAGIAILNPDGIIIEKHYGLVQDAIQNNATTLDGVLSGAKSSIGHVLYGTSNPDRTSTNSIDKSNDIQPILGEGKIPFALAHNGHVENVYDLCVAHGIDTSEIETDSHGIAKLLSYYSDMVDLDFALDTVLPMLEGAYSLIVGTPDRMIGIRDPNGIRPLCIGEYDGDANYGHVLASEDSSLRTSNAVYLRDVLPGEILTIDDTGIRSRFINKEIEPRLCSFEPAYFARPDSKIEGISVYKSREAAGIQLAKEYPIIADVVIGVPDTGVQAAHGYAKESGTPISPGLFKNPYTGRTFISPNQISREIAVRLKLRPNPAVIEGQRLVVIDDSLVRGTTSKIFVEMLREAGAKEIYFLLATPPYKWPCKYGMATGNQEELFAAVHSLEEMKQELGVDGLGYLSEEGFVQSIGLPAGKLCTACTTGRYPIPVPQSVSVNIRKSAP